MTSPSTPSPSATVLGLGGCLDYETVWDADVMTALAAEHRIGLTDLDRGDALATERDLVRSILAFVRDGVGGERAVADESIVESVAARHERRVTLGGTSVRAGLAMSVIGVPSTLHLVSQDPQMRALLPAGVAHVSSASEDSVHPHLIMQFPEGTEVRLADGTRIVAPRSNRLIYVCDPPNRDMVLSDQLSQMLGEARVFLISGFNSMTDQAQLEDRMRQLREAMAAMPQGSVVMLEDAGYHVPGFERVVIDRLGDAVDVHSMNEDELQAHLGREVDLLDPVDVADALRSVRRVVRAATVVIHTQYWALAEGPLARSLERALEGGTAMAAARYLHGDAVTASEVEGMAAYPRRAQGEVLAGRLRAVLGADAVVVPAFSLTTQTATTIGLGDAFVGGFVAALATGLTARDEPVLR